MSIYVKGIDMPEWGEVIEIRDDGTIRHRMALGSAFVAGAAAYQVPDHGDLIDRTQMREATIYVLDKVPTDQEANAIRELWSHLGQLPTIIPEDTEDET